MKRTLFLLFLLALPLLAVSLPAQEFPTRIAGANIGFCQSCDPQIGGGVYFASAILQNAHPTYSYSLVNIDKVTVNSWKPLNVQVVTSAETGIAQHAFRFARFDVFGLATAGIAADSSSIGMSFGGGGVAYTPLGKGWLLGGYLRVTKQAILPSPIWKVGLTIALGSN